MAAFNEETKQIELNGSPITVADFAPQTRDECEFETFASPKAHR